MQQILIYSDSLNRSGATIRIIEDCLNGRRTVWEDPFKPGRNGLAGLAQRIEIHSPLALVILMLGTNDFSMRVSTRSWAKLSLRGYVKLCCEWRSLLSQFVT